MILTMTKMFDMRQGRYSILAYGPMSWWIMEREWAFNRPNVSCVPRDEYLLEPHSSEKYPDTWALIGDGVSHYQQQGIPRFACVLHSAVYPTDLEGCLSPCLSLNTNGVALGGRESMDDLRDLFDSATGPIKILMQ
jgi:hypothetical protein